MRAFSQPVRFAVSVTALFSFALIQISQAAEITVTNLNDDGVGSLRDAMVQANLTGQDDVVFGGLSGTINIVSQLPALTDGSTRILGETGNIRLTGPAAVSGGTDGIVIDGADHCVIRGLEIDSFARAVVLTAGSSQNTIGGADAEHAMNIHHNYTGVVFDGQGADTNFLTYCSIHGQVLDGVQLLNRSANNFIGLYRRHNFIYSNGRHGILLFSNEQMGLNVVSENWIGWSDPFTAAGNTGDGIHLRSTHPQRQRWNILAENTFTRNYIGHNGGNGITLSGVGVGNNTLRENIIGMDPFSPVAAAPNGGHGIHLLDGAHDNEFEVNIANGSSGDGVRIEGADTDHNRFATNMVGLSTFNAPGAVGIGNGGDGFELSGGCQNNLITSNVVGDNDDNGIRVAGRFTHMNRIVGNQVGLAYFGSTAIPNGDGPGEGGILLDDEAQGNTVDGNTVVGHAGTDQFGIAILGRGATRDNVLQNNRVGINLFESPIPNATGILVEDSWNRVGPMNIVSGNSGYGIDAHGAFIEIISNRVGTNSSGDAAVPNLGGMHLEVTEATIDGNLISGNRNWGIEAQDELGAARIGNTVTSNWIGVDVLGNPLGNGAGGVWVRSSFTENLVGGSQADANVVANNGGPGVRIGETGVEFPPNLITILYNSIFNNAGKGIDLFSSVPPGNDGIQAPVVLTASTTAATGTTNLADGVIQVFYDEGDEGRYFLGEVDITSSGWAFTFPEPVPETGFITATQTEGTSGPRNTSEFSNAVATQILQVGFDVYPGSCVNLLNPKIQGVIPTAILGTEEFDVRSIDVSTVRLEGVSPRKDHFNDVSTAQGIDQKCTEHGADGFEDLVLNFPADLMVDVLDLGGVGREIALMLTGTLLDGTPFEASDSVTVKGDPGGTSPASGEEPGGERSGAPGHAIGEYGAEIEASHAGLEVAVQLAGTPGVSRQRVEFTLPESAPVKLSVFDVAGRLVARLAEGAESAAGVHSVEWDTSGLPSGVYFLHLEAGPVSQTQKMLLVH